MDSSAKTRVGNAALGGILIALGIFIAVETLLLSASSQRSTIGPKFFPVLIAVGLTINGFVLLWEAFRQSSIREEWPKLDMWPVMIVLIGLILQMVLLEPAGWVIATMLLFVVIARAFGSRRVLLDLSIGFVLSVLSFYLFNEALGLSLPGGFIADYFDEM
jgi:putative tricarboxylic transport membrane protein